MNGENPTRSAAAAATGASDPSAISAANPATKTPILLKVAPPERLIDAVRTGAAGGGLLDPTVTLRVIESFAHSSPLRTQPAAALGTLTEREKDC